MYYGFPLVISIHFNQSRFRGRNITANPIQQSMINEMNCNNDKIEMQKITTDKTICVYETSAQKLISRGYATLDIRVDA